MSNISKTTSLPRVLFFGMLGKFSFAPLYALLETGIQVCAVVIPSEERFEAGLSPIQMQEQPQHSHVMLPVLNSSIHFSILDLARERNIPVWKVLQLSNQETIQALTVYQPDLICVACFSKRMPRDILNIPRFGCLNVHPSLLPANRGPDPIFWAFREGSAQTGVTIHLMDEGLDSGAIVAQETVEIPDGISYSELEERIANQGGKLLARSVWDVYNGVAKFTAQDQTKSSYHPFPSDVDFSVPVAEWNARHVYNFICGVASLGYPLYVHIDNKIVQIKKALSYSQETTNEKDSNARDGGIWVRCKQGSVLVSP